MAYKGRPPEPYWDNARGVYRFNYIGPDGKQKKATLGHDKDQAWKAWDTLKRKLLEQQCSPGTLGEAIDTYLALRQDDLVTNNGKTAELTYVSHWRFLNEFANFPCPQGGKYKDMRLIDFTAAHVDRFLRSKRKNWSAATERLFVTHLQTCFNVLSDDKYKLGIKCPFDIMSLDKPQAPQRRKGQYGVDTPEKLNAILAEIKSEKLKLFVRYLYHCGCRPGWARKLKVGDVDKETWGCTLPEGIISKNKLGGEDTATWYAEPEGRAILAQLCEGRADSEHVFTNHIGRMWTQTALTRQFGLLRKRLKNGNSRLYPYSFRVGFISRKLAEGVPINVVASLVNHANTRVISKNYDLYSRAPETKRSWLDRPTEVGK
jgi:integrase